MKQQSFLEGTMLLMLAGLIIKVLGLLSRIPLSRLLGGEGIGLYQMAYPIFGMAIVLSVSGLPLAISKMVAERLAKRQEAEARKIFRVAFLILALTGFVTAVFLFKSADWLARVYLREPRAALSLKTLSPAVFIIAMEAALRGYFQGRQEMAPTALSQVCEQLVRVTTMLVMTYLLLPLGIEYAAAGATFGAVTGAIAALLVLLWFQRRMHRVHTLPVARLAPARLIVTQLVSLAAPIILISSSVSIMDTINAALIPARLQRAGLTPKEALTQFGYLTGMALPLVDLVQIFSGAMSTSLVPAISEAKALRQHSRVAERIEQAVRISLIIGLPAAAGLYLLATPLCETLYQEPQAGVALTSLAVAALFLVLQDTSAALLHGLGKSSVAVRHVTIASIIHILLCYVLIPLPGFQIRGAGLAESVGLAISSLLNLAFVACSEGFTLRLQDSLLKPLLGVWAMVLLIPPVYQWIAAVGGPVVAVLGSSLVGFLVYIIVILFTGALSPQELALLRFRQGPKS